MKKIMLLMQSVLLFLLTGCGVLMEVYRPIYNNDAYFVTKTEKIKNPYQLNHNEKNAITSRGWQVGGDSFKYIYTNDRVSGLYNQQFVKTDIPELDMNLIKTELEVQDGREEPKIANLYLCHNDKENADITELNNFLANNYSKLKGAVNREVDRFTRRENMQVEILSARTISYKDKGRIQCNSHVELSVKILKQQEFPEVTIGMNMDYLGSGGNKLLKPTAETKKAHDEIFKRIMSGYFQFEAKTPKFSDFKNKVEEFLGGAYIFKTKNDSLRYGRNEEVFPSYYFGNGISIQANLADYDHVTSFLENHLQPDFTRIEHMKNEKSPEHVVIEIRPIKENEIVSPQKLKELRKKINGISKEVFGYEMNIALEVYASFRVIKTGISEQVIGYDEFYHIRA